jgi:tungstate transport system ATP-binding protein
MKLTLTASHIRKQYDGKTILADCTFSFDRSGVYVLTGANGSGKSTFLRICALLEDQSSGEITYSAGDAPLAHDNALRRRTTLVLPRIGVFNTTAFKNVAYGLKVRGVPGQEIETRVSKALAFVGLEHKASQRALTLSSGETQRLGIARALVIEPEILFLDEPTASIDQENTEIVEQIILKMKKEDKSMIIMTTHDAAQAERLADRMLLMQDGRITEVGE